ncbi:MAG TPA: NADH-quinone oxidoreductase subunit NuoN [Segeticoccus sp.]|uniref:NADH-quinone oxidoreductase subunit NuoN n=1 Tax=Segeticoccus sp. TaxID=2706531 RepID=UPI002D7EF8BE|nr:NADH-quinone oxidoreductase subunit NuoN [Segeticoccus sp.]HET8601729.1 NADH-quinone oxidoreductase subunit NuoN [Segeticoccus sp.]
MPAAFTAPTINYGAVLPMLIVFGVALAGVLVEAFAPRGARYLTQVILSVLGLAAALAAIATTARTNQGITFDGEVVIDGPALLLQGVIVALSLLAVLAMAERFDGRTAEAFTPAGASTPGSVLEARALRAGMTTTEVFPLTLFAVGGMMLFPASGDLLVMFIALEVLSLPLYILSGLARRRRLLSQEASLKYFLLGAFSSAFFLFGSALLYGFAGSMNFGDIAQAIPTQTGKDGLLTAGVLLVAIGLLFKTGAAPFHSWTPDVYQGAPSPVSGFMAACTKVAAFGALLRVLYVGFAGDQWSWYPFIWAVAVLTMVVGSVLSVTQTDMKRLLAYSSIAHCGFVLVGVLALSKIGVAGVLFYLASYGFSIIAAFAVVALVRERGTEATNLSQWAGLGKRHPVVAGVFAFLLLAFAGIPFTSGFTAKFATFAPAIASGGAMGVWLVVVGVLTSAITAFVYFRVIVLMYFSEPTGETRVAMPTVVSTVAITIGTLATLVLGIVPSPLLDLATSSSQFLR